eukprot:TRINITY_DN64036_c0_g1_i1.p1 TRINITY_DN64036_c0_g1~~TRINITY_DN64036_c0_g1_i1.p1  ORF type:complete len:321 (+),score=60.30 TRINITY_DN64036_c0_g1_i1:122-1084(+)
MSYGVEEPVVHLSTYVLWFGAFCVNSAGMTIINKIVMNEVGVPYMVLGFQQCVAISVYFSLHFLVGRKDASSVWHIKPFTFVQVRRLLVVGANFAFILATSLMALPLVTVATVVVFRNVCTCVIAILERSLFGKNFTLNSWFAIFVTLVGSIIYAGTDINYDPAGYFWQVANSIFFSFGQLYEKWNMTRTTDQTATGVATIKACLSLFVVAVMVPSMGELEHFRNLKVLSPVTVALLFTSSVGAIGMGVIYMTLYQIASATATTVAGNFNKVVSIVVGALVFSSRLSTLQCVGLFVSSLGSLWWSLETIKAPSAPAKKAT